MFESINKYKVSILWATSVSILIVSFIIAETKPFSEKASALIIFISFSLALLAMIFSAIRRKRRYRVILYILFIVYYAVDTLLGFIQQ